MNEIDKLLRRTGMVKSSPTGTDNQMMNKLYSSTDYKEYQKRKEEEEKRRAEGRKRDERLKAEIGAVKDIAKADSPTIEKEVPKYDSPMRSLYSKDFQEKLNREITETRRINAELGYSDEEIDEMLIPTTEEDRIERRLEQISKEIKDIDFNQSSRNVDTPLMSMTGMNPDFQKRINNSANYGAYAKAGYLESEARNLLSEEAVKAMNGKPNKWQEVQKFMDEHPELSMAQPKSAFEAGAKGMGERLRLGIDSTESAIRDNGTYIVAAAFLGAGAALAGMGATTGAALAGKTATSALALPVYGSKIAGYVAAMSPLAAAGAGMSHGSMEYMKDLEAGMAYTEYMQDPEVHPEAARIVAETVGGYNGIVEYLEIGSWVGATGAMGMAGAKAVGSKLGATKAASLIANIPGASAVKSKAFSIMKNELFQKATEAAGAYGFNLGSNILEELVQESNTSIGLALAKELSKQYQNTPNPHTLSGLEIIKKTASSQQYKDRMAETAIQSAKSLWLGILAGGAGRTVGRTVTAGLENSAKQKALNGWFTEEEAKTQYVQNVLKENILADNGLVDQMAGEVRNNKDKTSYKALAMVKAEIETALEYGTLTNEDRSRAIDKLNVINEAIAEVEFEAKENDNTIVLNPTEISEVRTQILSGEIKVNVNDFNIEQYRKAIDLGIDQIVFNGLKEDKTISTVIDEIQKVLPKKERSALEAGIYRRAVLEVENAAKIEARNNLLSNYDKTEGTLVENEATESPQTGETQVSNTNGQVDQQNATMDATEHQSEVQAETPVEDVENQQYETPKSEMELENGKYKPSDVVRVPVTDINVDPRRFQFRFDGTTDKLAGTEWNDDMAGTVLLWENEYGDLYVVNGHHRVSLAQDNNVVELDAKILRGVSEQEARAQGALLNIAEGSASSVDVAKYMRDTGSTLENMVELGVPPKSKIARDGEALSKLDDGLFQRAATKQIPIERAILIGREFGDNKAAQVSFHKALVDIESRGKTLTNNVIQEMIAQEKGMVQESFTEQTLLGEEENTKSLRVERAEVVAYVKDQLGKKKSLLKNVSQKKNAEVLESVGNKIDTEKSMAEMTLAEQALFLLDKTLNQVGTMTNKMFNEFASQYAKGDKITVKKQALNRFIQAMESGEILEEAFGRKTASEQATDALTQDNIPGQADMLGNMTQIKNEPRINVVVNPNTPDTVVETFMPILEAMEKNPIFNGLEIEFSGTDAREVVFTDKELKEHGYDNLQEGVHKVYGWFERPSGEGQQDQGSNYKGKITLTNGADKGTLLHETIHFIQDRLNQINPELSAVVSTWENMIREQAAEQGIDVWNGKELLANALTMGEYGYANDNWAESRLVGVDPQIVSEMSVILGKDFLKAAKGDMRASSVKKVTADLKKYANDQLKGTELASNIAQAKKRRINKIKMQLRDNQTVTYYSPDTTTYAIAIPTDTQYEVSVFNETGLLVQAEMTADKLASKLSEMGLYFNPQEVSYQLKTHNRTQIDQAFLGEQVELLRAIQNARVGNFTAKDYDTTLKGKLNQREADDILTSILSAATKGFDKPNSEITFTEYRNRFYSDRDPNQLRARVVDDKVQVYRRDFIGYEPRTPEATVPEIDLGTYDTAAEAIEAHRDFPLYQRDVYVAEAELQAEYEDFRDNYETYREDFDVMFDGNIKFNISYQVKQAADITTENFKKWFKDSKVVDEEGNPMPMYHGTGNATFTEFDINKSEVGLYGKGFYFTDDNEIANSYSRVRSPYHGVLSVEPVAGAWNKENTAKLKQIVSDEVTRLENAYGLDRNSTSSAQYRNMPTEEAYYFKALAIIDKYGVYEGEISQTDIVPWLDAQYNRDKITSLAEANGLPIEILMSSPGVYESYLSINNALDINNHDLTNTEINYIFQTEDAETISTYAGSRKFEDIINYLKSRLYVDKVTEAVRNLHTRLQRLGYDGITHIGGRVVGEKEHRVYIAFKPTQIKSVYNNGQFSEYDPNINYQLKQSAVDVEGFYSNLERVLDDKLGSKGKAQDILNMLQKNGVKPEEMEWFRIAEFLEGKDMVTKEEILDHMQERRIELKKEDMGNKFTQHTLHEGKGGSNYTFNAYIYNNNPGQLFRKSAHYGDKENVLAHTRYTDRIDTLGNRILFIEELQSDWHQEGRDKGYTSQPAYAPPITMKWIPESVDYNRMTNTVIKNEPHWESYDDNTGELISRHFMGGDKREAALAEAKENAYLLGDPRTPDAPLKNSITDFMFKTAIKDAVEGGYDRIAWTTGEQQADRYSMRQIVDTLQWIEEKETPGKGTLHGYRDGRQIVNSEMDESKLVEYIGKSLAQELLSQEGDGYNEFGYQRKTLKGEQLEIGGEFHKKLYNNYIPRMVKKYAKRWGLKPEVIEMGQKNEMPALEKSRAELLEEKERLVQQSVDWEMEMVNKYGYRWLSELTPEESARHLDIAAKVKEIDTQLQSVKYFDEDNITQQLSIPVTTEMIEDVMTNGQPLFQIKTEGDLLAVHNLTVEELKGSVKLQGLPMASIAVTRKDYEHTRYGDVSILFNSSTIDPRADRNNRVYSGDAYTPSFPRIERKINEDVTETIRMKVINTLEGTEYRRIFNTLLDDDNVSDKIDRWGSFEAAYSDDPLFQLTYLTEKGIEFEPVMKKKNYGWDYEIMDKLQEYLADKLEDFHISVQEAKELEPGIRQIINDYYRNVEMKEGFLKTRFQNEGFFAEPLGFGKVDSIYRSVWEYANDESREVIDTYGTKDKLETVVDKPDYLNWLSEMSDGIIEREGIWNGKEIFTPSGNRRSWESLHYDVTLDNIVKAMKNEDEKAAGMFGGIGRFGAAASRAYSSIDDIKGDMDRLTTMDEETYEAMREEFNERLTALASRIADPRESNQFIAIDRAFEAMVDAIQSSRLPSKVKSTLKKYRGLRITDEAVSDLISLAQEVAQMPTEYFEAKPRRAIGFEEWAGVVLPNDVDNELVTALQQNGIHFIEFYDRNIEGDRQRAVNELLGKNDVSFQVKKTDTDTEAFKNWFKDSKVVDESGNPLTVYHGTLSAGFDTFIPNGAMYFTSDRSYAQVYSNNSAEVLPVQFDNYEEAKTEIAEYGLSLVPMYWDNGRGLYESMEELESRNPEATNVTEVYDLRNERGETIRTFKSIEELRNDVGNYLAKHGNQAGVYSVYANIQNPYTINANAARWDNINGKSINEIVREARDSDEGYDGVIIQNVEDTARGVRNVIDMYVPFSPNQIKSVYNTGAWSAETADIYYQIKDEQNRDYDELSWTETVANSDITSPELKAILTSREYIYEVAHNEDTILAAAKLLEDKGEMYVRDKLSKPGVDVDHNVMAAGGILHYYYMERGDAVTAEQIVADMGTKAKNMGQGIQILAMLSKQSPTGMVRLARREFEGRLTDKQRAVVDTATKNLTDKAKDINARAIDRIDVESSVNKVKSLTQDEINKRKAARDDTSTRDYIQGEFEGIPKTDIDTNTIIETIKEHYKGNGRRSLFDALVEKGLNEVEADLLATTVKQQMKEFTSEELQETINQTVTGKADAVDTQMKDLLAEGRYGEALRKMVGQKKNIPVLTSDLVNMIYERGKEIQQLPPGREKDVETHKLWRDVSEQLPVPKGNKISTFHTMMMLLNFKTMARNLIGNDMFRRLDTFVLNTLGSTMDRVYSEMNHTQRTTLLRLRDAHKQQRLGYKEGFSTGLEDALLGIDTSSFSNKYELKSVRSFNRNSALGKMETALNIGLRATDRAAVMASYFDSLSEQMQIAGVTEATPEMHERALTLGLYRTFNDTTRLSETFTGLKKVLNKVGLKDGSFGLGDLVLKFPRTPANILARALDYSPVGAVMTVFKVAAEADPYLKQRMMVEGYARALAGTSIIGIGAGLASLGILTGSEPDEDKDLYELQKQSGLREFSINMSAFIRNVSGERNASDLRPGDTLLSYDWAQPLSIPLAVGADAVCGSGEALDFLSTTVRAAEAGVTTLTEQPLLTGVANLFRYGDPVQGMTNALKGLPASFSPSLLSQVAQAMDGGATNPYSFYPVGRQAWNMVANKLPGNLEIGDIPFGRGQIPDRIGVMGEEERWFGDDNFALRLAKSTLSPMIISEYMPSEEAQFLMDLYKASGNPDVIPNSPQRQYTVYNRNDEKVVVKPTAEQFVEWSKWLGENTKNDIADAMRYGSNWSAEDMADEVKYLINERRKELKDMIERDLD